MTAQKILIADDDAALVRLMALSLRKAGYEVIAAADGCQAVEFAHRHKPDLYILDVNMPAGTGMSVHERVQKSLQLCMSPILYLTGDKREEIKFKAKEMGAAGVLYKPLETDELINAVRATLAECN